MTPPYNPALANAFFRAGEIETWGRGIQRIFEACQEAGTPAPVIDYKPNDLWIEFPFAPEYLKAIATTSQSEAQSGGPVRGPSQGAQSGGPVRGHSQGAQSPGKSPGKSAGCCLP
jgi:ATP-dependent DNA helicase RecG